MRKPKLRSHDGRIMGSGINLAFVEEEEVWKDKKEKYILFPQHDSKPVDLWDGTIDELDEETKQRLGLI